MSVQDAQLYNSVAMDFEYNYTNAFEEKVPKQNEIKRPTDGSNAISRLTKGRRAEDAVG
jgi:hypothetical protein